MRKISRLMAVLTMALVTTSCATAPGTNAFDLRLPMSEDKSQIPAKECVVATFINYRQKSKYALDYKAKLAFRKKWAGFNSGLIPLESGVKFYVFSLKPGDYKIAELFLDGLFSEQFKDVKNFSCSAQTVTYIGDIRISVDIPEKKFGIEITDEFEIAKETFTDLYPVMSSEYEISNQSTSR